MILRKCAHMTEYTVLAFLLARAFEREAPGAGARHPLRRERRVPPGVRPGTPRLAHRRRDRHGRAADRAVRVATDTRGLESGRWSTER